MKTVSLDDLPQFLLHLSSEGMESGDWGFRGVPSISFQPIPSIGRSSSRESYDQDLEKLVFDSFRQAAVPFVPKTPDSLMTWLALARHHGLPTRLLDWTLSPLVAAFFATSQSSPSEDGFAIYAYESQYFQRAPSPVDPFNLEEDISEIHSDHYSERMAAQREFFTVHRRPEIPFDHPSLKKFVFSERMRAETLNQLDFYGINQASMFPGPDGIAAYWSWFYKIST